MPNEKDDFWDISSLLPPKKKTITPVFAPKTDTAELSVGSEKESDTSDRRLTFRGSESKQTVREYVPAWNPMIKHVAVSAYKTNYRVFHVFKNEAAMYAQKRGVPSPFADFFSYAPQYAQMNASQLAYYLYFRDELNEGRAMKATQSYLMLYFYEIVNLPDIIPPNIGVLRLAKAWMLYRRQIPAIEKYMVVWLADYALIHGVPCPNEILADALPDILAASRFKEFYLGMDKEFSACRLDAFLALASEYDFKNGRYAKGEHGELFVTHVREAARLVLESVLSEKEHTAMHQTVTKTYDAYIGAICAEEHNYRLEVTYCSVSGTESLRAIMTAAVKYAENKVRAYLSVKSRLSVIGLPQSYKEMIDAYFAARLVKKSVKEREARPEYEALYDAPSIGISGEEASRIESTSWENTVRLIPEEEREALFAKAEEDPSTASAKADAPLPAAAVRFLDAFYRLGRDGAQAYASQNGLLFEGACESINEYFSDTMGDIVIELDGEDTALIEDYETEVKAFLEAYLKNE